MLYDTHAHLDSNKLYPDIENVLHHAREAGVQYINTIGCDWKSSLLSVRLAEKYPEQLFAAIGVHPHEAKDMTEEHLMRLLQLASAEKVVAWGEIGLDYHYDFSPREVQKNVFIQQIEAAHSAKLPIIIHNRESHQDMLEIIKQQRAGQYGGVLHCFSGSWEMAKQCLSLGFYLSFAGPVTFANAKMPIEVASKVPLDRLLIETDSPYLAPQPHRGKTNMPGHVRHVAEKIAEIRGLSFAEIAEQTTANAIALFHQKRSTISTAMNDA